MEEKASLEVTITTSQKLNREWWPINYSAAMVDGMRLSDCIALRQAQDEAKKVVVVRKKVMVEQGADNGMDVLHPCRGMRPCTGEKKTWAELIPQYHEQILPAQ